MRVALIVTAFLVVAQYAAYTYASPALQRFAGVSESGVAGMLLLMGVAGLLGNLGSAPVMRRRPVLALIMVAGGMTLGVVALMLATGPLTGGLAMVTWGLFGGAMAVTLQYWVLTSAGDVAEPAAALDSGIFNLGIGIGAALGGGILTVWSITGVFACAAAGMFLALLLVLGYRQRGHLR